MDLLEPGLEEGTLVPTAAWEIEARKREVCIDRLTVEAAEIHAGHLFRAHADEAEPELADYVDPDWEKYRALERTGSLIGLGAWIGKHPIGYCSAFLFDSGHYRGYKVCQHDLLYVLPQWRGRVGLKLIDRLRDEARARGALRFYMMAKTGSRLERLLPKLGFEIEETVFKQDL